MTPLAADHDLFSRWHQDACAPVLGHPPPRKASAKVRGLNIGADACLTKLVGNSGLAARAHALLRRRPAERQESDVYNDGRLLVMFGSH